MKDSNLRLQGMNLAGCRCHNPPCESHATRCGRGASSAKRLRSYNTGDTASSATPLVPEAYPTAGPRRLTVIRMTNTATMTIRTDSRPLVIELVPGALKELHAMRELLADSGQPLTAAVVIELCDHGIGPHRVVPADRQAVLSWLRKHVTKAALVSVVVALPPLMRCRFACDEAHAFEVCVKLTDAGHESMHVPSAGGELAGSIAFETTAPQTAISAAFVAAGATGTIRAL